MVCDPATIVTVAVPAAKLLLTSNPAVGKVLTLVSVVPGGRTSAINAEPAGNCSGVPHVPSGAAPAATITFVPAT